MKIICTVPRCMKEAAMATPGDWCLEHWNEWYGHKGRKEPKWMKHPVKHQVPENLGDI